MSELERTDELYHKNYRILQDKGSFCFGTDAVVLAGFARVRPGDRITDLCCGNGVIPLLLAAKSQAKEIFGLEIMAGACDLARRSVALNGEEGRIFILQGDVKNPPVELKAGSFDVVTANPPYQERGKSLSPERAGHLAAREEIFCTLLDVLKTAAALLRFGGSFFMVFRPERLVDVFEQMRSQKIEPKRICMVHPRMGKEPAMVLIEGRKGGARQLRVEAPLFIYDGEGAYTKEMRLIYGREE